MTEHKFLLWVNWDRGLYRKRCWGTRKVVFSDNRLLTGLRRTRRAGARCRAVWGLPTEPVVDRCVIRCGFTDPAPLVLYHAPEPLTRRSSGQRTVLSGVKALNVGPRPRRSLPTSRPMPRRGRSVAFLKGSWVTTLVQRPPWTPNACTPCAMTKSEW